MVQAPSTHNHLEFDLEWNLLSSLTLRSSLLPVAGGVVGHAAIRALAMPGRRFLLCGRQRERLDAAAALAHAAGASAEIITLDLGQAQERIVFQQHIAAFGRLDILIHAAAIQGPIGKLAEISFADWTKTLEINLTAPAHLLALLHPLLKKAKRRGKVVVLSGGGATGPRPGFCAYAVAKTGVLRLVETVAVEWVDDGIDVMALAPGVMVSAMTAEVLANPAAGVKEHAAIQKAATEGSAAAERAAAAIAWLISERGDRLTGRLISAVWDPWSDLDRYIEAIQASDIYALRRVVPKDRGEDWGS